MISLKRYIDSEHTASTLLRTLVDACQAVLSAFAAGAAQACPTAEPALELPLTALGAQLARADTPEQIDATGIKIAGHIQRWADAAEADRHKRVADVRELLVTLAQTASSVAATDAAHVLRFDALTARLEQIASFEDVTELRTAVLSSARELRESAESLSQSTRSALRDLQSELGAYQSKLEEAEKMAAHDPLTGLFNRRKIEAQIERRIERGRPFCIGLIDLDGFKGINDSLGHRSGDDLLRQFSADLKANSRAADTVGRWGGDEFILVVDGPLADVRTQFARLQQWIAGTYTLQGPQGKTKVQIDVSIGASEWRPGLTAAALIEAADAQMYKSKRTRR